MKILGMIIGWVIVLPLVVLFVLLALPFVLTGALLGGPRR